jgi:plastocyanin
VPSRRGLVVGGGLLLAAPALRRVLAADMVEIRMRSDPEGAHVAFDPIGLRVAPGTTVRWVVEANVRIPTKPARHSNLKPATHSDAKPAGVPI